MRKSILLLFSFAFFTASLQAQEYILGKVTNEDEKPIPGIQIINTTQNKQAITDAKGLFMIAAQKGDEVRIVSENYDRVVFRVTIKSFEKSKDITLIRKEELIPEVEIAFKPTGILERDVKMLNRTEKVEVLKQEIESYVATSPRVARPKLSMPTTLQQGPNFSAGQVNMLGIVQLGIDLITKAVKPKVTTANFLETQQFFTEVKNTVNMEFFKSAGLDESEFDLLLAFANERYDLAKKYRKNLDAKSIENYLKMALKEFRDSRKSAVRMMISDRLAAL